MTISLTGIIQRSSKYEGVRQVHIYLLRLLYILMFFVLGRETWTRILMHQGPWDPFEAVAWCVWTAFATLAGNYPRQIWRFPVKVNRDEEKIVAVLSGSLCLW